MKDQAKSLGLGPKSWQMLRSAGIADLESLRAYGAVQAYAKVKQCWPAASLNLLWAIEGALSNRDWREVCREDSARLLMGLQAYE